MLIGQLGRLDFGHFFFWCAPPSVLSLGAAYLIIRRVYRKDLRKSPVKKESVARQMAVL